MKKVLIDIAIGIGVVVLVFIGDAISSFFIYATPNIHPPDSEELTRLVNVEWLGAAIPAFLITAVLAIS